MKGMIYGLDKFSKNILISVDDDCTGNDLGRLQKYMDAKYR